MKIRNKFSQVSMLMVLATSSFAGCAVEDTTEEIGKVELALGDQTARMTELLSEAGGTVGFYTKQVGGPVVGSLNETFVYDPASSIKTLVGVGILQLIEQGAASLSSTTTFHEVPSGTSCPDNSTPAQTRTLDSLIYDMLVFSSNSATRALVDYLGGFSGVNQVALTNGMTSTTMIGYPGCIANEMTQLDSATLYEGIVDGTLLSPSSRDALYARMPSDTVDFTSTLYRANQIVDQVAPTYGLDANQIAAFKSQLRLHYKAGNGAVCLDPCQEFYSIGGVAEIPVCDGSTQDVAEYVWSVFIHGAPMPGGQNTFFPTHAEPLREPIELALSGWSECTEGGGDCLASESVPGLPTWTVGNTYGQGVQVQYGGKAYECVQASCTAQAGWEPGAPGLTSVWAGVALCGIQPWEAGIAYPVDYVVSYGGQQYRCLTAHTSNSGWTPSAAPTLWAVD